ncbi:protein CYSTEINE-RICH TRANSMEMBRANE MODULE 9-like [Arachis stenosperma]|uniref:protein CYSTEINE-RICH TRANSMEMBRANE MODULE 9-like n=1 Tax=Arachis stenosperma TaxID=217475 RepID=UPI0025ABCA01|nr:protein CYSTEINE-RICH TRANSMEMBRANE MODULE 9-like [Arachis stenosperma]
MMSHTNDQNQPHQDKEAYKSKDTAMAPMNPVPGPPAAITLHENYTHQVPPYEEQTKFKGGFWRGFCAGLCCGCCLDICF